MRNTTTLSARPKVTWCLMVTALVFIFIAMGVVLFLTPGHGNLIHSAETPSRLLR